MRFSYISYLLMPRLWFIAIRHPKGALRTFFNLIREPQLYKVREDFDMQFLQLILRRHSVRSYKTDPVEEDKLNQVLEAARLAPTAGNRQPFKLIVIHTPDKKAELRRIYDRAWFVQAPLVICACGIPDQASIRTDGKNFCDIDVAIVMDHLILAATDLGLGTCWIGAFNPSAARNVLGLPDNVQPIAFTPLGYPNYPPIPKRRKPFGEIVNYERWQG